jgi:hypothetical protein
MPPQRAVLPEVFPELLAAMERRARQRERERSDELSAAYQKIIELEDTMRTVASMLAFHTLLQDEISLSASDSHDSRRLIAAAMAALQQKITEPL